MRYTPEPLFTRPIDYRVREPWGFAVGVGQFDGRFALLSNTKGWRDIRSPFADQYVGVVRYNWHPDGRPVLKGLLHREYHRIDDLVAWVLCGTPLPPPRRAGSGSGKARSERDGRILRAHLEGQSVAAIAQAEGLSVPSIYRILAQAKAARAPEDIDEELL